MQQQQQQQPQHQMATAPKTTTKEGIDEIKQKFLFVEHVKLLEHFAIEIEIIFNSNTNNVCQD